MQLSSIETSLGTAFRPSTIGFTNRTFIALGDAYQGVGCRLYDVALDAAAVTVDNVTRTRAQCQPANECLDRFDHVFGFRVDQVDQGAYFGQVGARSAQERPNNFVTGSHDRLQHPRD